MRGRDIRQLRAMKDQQQHLAMQPVEEFEDMEEPMDLEDRLEALLDEGGRNE